jgi:hypothetical protein
MFRENTKRVTATLVGNQKKLYSFINTSKIVKGIKKPTQEYETVKHETLQHAYSINLLILIKYVPSGVYMNMRLILSN